LSDPLRPDDSQKAPESGAFFLAVSQINPDLKIVLRTLHDRITGHMIFSIRMQIGI